MVRESLYGFPYTSSVSTTAQILPAFLTGVFSVVSIGKAPCNESSDESVSAVVLGEESSKACGPVMLWNDWRKLADSGSKCTVGGRLGFLGMSIGVDERVSVS